MVVEELGRSIVTGRLAEGSILPGDQELMERFDVSRTVLREAMKTLSAKRLIEAKARVGTRVCSKDTWNTLDADVIDAEFVTQLADMRQAMEPAIIAALAARPASSEEMVALYAIAARFDDATHTRESIARMDLEFHLANARMSRNPFMQSASSLVEAALAVSFQISSPALSREGIARCASDHLKIAHAIAARGENKARLAMNHVIDEGLTERSPRSRKARARGRSRITCTRHDPQQTCLSAYLSKCSEIRCFGLIRPTAANDVP